MWGIFYRTGVIPLADPPIHQPFFVLMIPDIAAGAVAAAAAAASE